MPSCDECKKFYPPGFVERVDGKTKKCIFCEKGSNEVRYGDNNEKVAKRDDIVLEYQKYLRIVREENRNIELLKKGKLDVPEKFRKG